MKNLLMWASDQRTEFVESDNEVAPGKCKRARGGTYYGVAEPHKVFDFIDSGPDSAYSVLSFIIDNAWNVPAKNRARYMLLMTHCIHNALVAKELK